MYKFVTVMVLFALTLVAGAETGVVQYADMIVQSEELKPTIRVGKDSSIARALEATPGIIVNSQGVAGGQSDLSVRGSSFSGAGISLGNLALNSPQTEHFNAELPFASGLFSSPRIVGGFDQLLATDGHLVGSVDLEVRPIVSTRTLTVGATEDNGYWLNILVGQNFDIADGRAVAGIGGFGSHTVINSVDYDDNDLETSRGGGQIQVVSEDSKFDFLAGYQKKDFGARGYYGVTPDWKATEKTEDLLLLASYIHGDLADSYWRTSIMRRQLEDDYKLYWSLPGTYHNQHKTVVYSGSVGGRNLFGEYLTMDWRSTIEDERIVSKSLGNHDRTSYSGMLLPGILLSNWKIHAGVVCRNYENGDNKFLPQGAIAYSVSPKLKMRLSHSQTMRQPSYTELNYQSPASLGNSGLKNQKSEATELRFMGNITQYASWHIAPFYRRTFDTVDWVRQDATSKRWKAQNLGTTEVKGVEGALMMQTKSGSHLVTSYTFLHKHSDAEFYSSRYAFDYPEHYFTLAALWQLSQMIGVEFSQSLRLQHENPLRTGSDTGYDGALSILLKPYKHIQLSLMVSNIWDDDFEYFPGQSTISPRRFSVGMTIDW